MKRYIKSAIVDPDPRDHNTMFAIFDDPKLRPNTLIDMYDKYPRYRTFIAHHPNTPVSLLLKLAEDTPACKPCTAANMEDACIFENLAINPNTTAEILDIIAHKCAECYTSVVCHPNVSYDTLLYISKAEDAGKSTRRFAIDTIHLREHGKK